MRIRGSSKVYLMHQWANDWVSATDPDKPEESLVLKPLLLEFTKAEYEKLRQDEATAPPRNSGEFWEHYQLHDGGNEHAAYLSARHG